MKLKKLKLHNAVVLNNSQMKAVWGRNGYDDPIDGGYLPEVRMITCSSAPVTEGGTGICWRWNGARCVFNGNPIFFC